MAVFSYRATTMDGETIEGVIEATDEKLAIERIKNTGVIPLKIVAPKQKGWQGKIGFRRSRGDLLTFTTELSVLLSAGLPLDRSLNILSEISEGKEMKKIVQSILKSIREGGSFSDALQKHPKAFPKLYINMIRAGETGGVLDVVLDKLNEFLESAKELKDNIFSAMIYPIILSVTGGASIIILLTLVLPKFSVIFAEIGGSIPLSTKVLLGISSGLRSYWWAILLFLVMMWGIVKSYLRSPRGRYNWDTLKLKLFGDVVKKLETARFCRTLGTLIRSGVSFLQALDNSRDVINNQAIASALDNVTKGAKEGKGISVPLADAGVFPPLALSMIKVGEETGQLDTMLIKVAAAYEKNLKETVKRFVGFLESIMILAMGLVIGFIVISMLLAIFSITDLPF
ncbi:MAG: type II secretion system F family protein [Syntrophorhabdaceae bacterium]|jgi:general secretion pathway protein F|nr:type II secretion system F family protein [Syntrophorhabdaceae bacterium]